MKRADLIRKLTRASSFTAGVVVIVVAVIYYLVGGREADRFVTALDDHVLDAMFRTRGMSLTSGQVVIVDIDEKSLSRLGQWPWPRTRMAELFRKIDAAGAKVAGLDIVFAEPDRTSPLQFAPVFQKYFREGVDPKAEIPDNDAVLGTAVGETRTVLGYFFQMSDDGLRAAKPQPPAPQFSIPATSIAPGVWVDANGKLQPPKNRDGAAHERDVPVDALNKVPLSYRPVLNLETIGQNCLSEGFFNAEPGSSGTIRQVPLFIRYDMDASTAKEPDKRVAVFYPSLPMEMLREGFKEAPKLSVGHNGFAGVSFGQRAVPTDDRLQICLNFRGPPSTFRYVSAVDVLDGVLGANTLRDKYVLIGTSTWGLRDLRATPFASTCPGVEILATVIDNILVGDPLRQDEYTQTGVVLTIIVLGGLLLAALLSYAGPVPGGIAGVVTVFLVVFCNYRFFFLRQQVVGVAYPLLTLLLVFVVVTLFNFFFEGREKRYIRGAFSLYVSPSVVDELVRRPEKLSLEGEVKVLSVMFSDIRGFTSISEKLKAREMSAFLNEYLTAMTDIIMGERGTVDKFIGDAIMAIWGAPLDDADHAANAARGSLRMMDRLHEPQKQWAARDLPFVDIGIGVNTGEMSVGNMGSRNRFDYTVIGDNVNLASRLEGLNKEYGTNILVSESTRTALGDAFPCRLVDQVRVKGKKLPVRIYELLGEGALDEVRKAEVAAWDTVLEQYFQREFAPALATLQRLHAARPLKLYELYLERLESFQANPPGADWDGVYTFTHK